jgi:isopenicillin N synthase-like dioxygenase
VAAVRADGFPVIAGHGVPDALVRRVFDVSLAFDLLDEKLATRSDDPGTRVATARSPQEPRGTYGLDTLPDLREQFFIGPLDDWRALPISRRPRYAPNVWPAPHGAPGGLHCVLPGPGAACS